jgi:hypothetical protein
LGVPFIKWFSKLRCVSHFQANEFSRSFQTYSYLWLDDRESCMQQFLTYGRQLTAEELELISIDDDMAPKPSPPTMELFREQVRVLKKSQSIFNTWHT